MDGDKKTGSSRRLVFCVFVFLRVFVTEIDSDSLLAFLD